MDAATHGLALPALFLPGVAFRLATGPLPNQVLLGAELRAAAGMAPDRRASFAQGRACARDCLHQLGAVAGALPVGEQRAPIWPPGFCGSISHCDGTAVAVAARMEVTAGLGIDLERRGELEPGVLPLVCTPAERARLNQEQPAGEGKLLFAIKESIYKCLWTRVRRFVDFQEVQVSIDYEQQSFRIDPAGTSLRLAAAADLRGRFAALDAFWLAGCYLPPAPIC